ncbi:39S ribosomal protein L1, mitochondrial [Pseudolycoriella hygida]|uniref:39S ribosomal protein L1, mitochondrial n=1 Tax=Pseudolycoriella hygida TaxID=35572 RepID=A0A9Q0RZS5_9DIPT|nr:39S ribosomal protein L1, mitochondrial [Pseudolycoriella hygida]
MMSCFMTLRRFAFRPAIIHPVQFIHTTPADAAARKGTREKARKKKVKVEIKKVGFIPHNQRGKDKLNLLRKDKHIDDAFKSVSKDDVWIGRYCRRPIYSFAEAVQNHRETHHPTIYNEPNAALNVSIELNMQAEKITRFVEKFQRMAMIPHKFEHGEERNIIVLARGDDILRDAREAGAALVGGVDVIGNIQKGDVLMSDYQFVLAHPNIMPDLVSIRGLMKRKFPNPRAGTLGVDLSHMVYQFLTGIQYRAIPDEYQKNFGKIDTCIGTINMDTKHLEANLVALLTDVNKMRPKREGKFVTRVFLTSPPSGEILKIDPFLYIPVEREVSDKTGNVEDVEEVQAEAAN